MKRLLYWLNLMKIDWSLFFIGNVWVFIGKTDEIKWAGVVLIFIALRGYQRRGL